MKQQKLKYMVASGHECGWREEPDGPKSGERA